MSLLKLGKTWLGTKVDDEFPAAAQFDTDPKITRDWAPRRVAFETVGGGVTHQSFGRYAADLTLTLASEGNWMSAAMKAYVDGLVNGPRNAVYDYRDYQGIEATVVIMDWAAKPTFVKDGLSVLYEYQMRLQVMDLEVLDFAAYSGT